MWLGLRAHHPTIWSSWKVFQDNMSSKGHKTKPRKFMARKESITHTFVQTRKDHFSWQQPLKIGEHCKIFGKLRKTGWVNTQIHMVTLSNMICILMVVQTIISSKFGQRNWNPNCTCVNGKKIRWVFPWIRVSLS